jgi:hypothetical protein
MLSTLLFQKYKNTRLFSKRVIACFNIRRYTRSKGYFILNIYVLWFGVPRSFGPKTHRKIYFEGGSVDGRKGNVKFVLEERG